MIMKNLSIIGSSNIIYHHLDSAKKCGFILRDICTTNKKSKNIIALNKKYKFKKVYFDWRKMLHEHKNFKNMHYLIAPRIKDADKILYEFLKLDKKILIEKPVSINSKNFKKFFSKSKNIFVAYNRIFYDSISFLKQKEIKNSFIKVFIPETSKKNFKKNSCHIISILLFLFDNLKITYKIKNKNFITVLFNAKNHNVVSLDICFGSSQNFSIDVYNKKKAYIFKPIEFMLELEGMTKKTVNFENFYLPKKIRHIDEYKKNKYKPGFLKMWKFFYKSDNTIHYNNIFFSYKIMKLCEDILK